VDWQLYPIDAFARYKQHWDSINSHGGNTPLLDTRFVAPLLHNFGSGEEILALCRIDGAICCMAIVTKTRYGVWHTFQPPQAPIGCWVQGNSLPTKALGSALLKTLPNASFMLEITQQDPGLLARPTQSANIYTIDYIDTARVVIDSSFEDYWSKRGKNLRQNLRRQRNRLARERVEARLSIISDPEAIYGAVKAYGNLESAGWKSESNTAIVIENAQGMFYAQMLLGFAQTDQALVFQYHYNDQLVATDLCIVGGGSLVILKTTYNESINTSSPAMLMREDAFNHIFSGQLAVQIEFYGRAMDWHRKWSEDIRTMYHVNICSKLGTVVRAFYKKT
jgi:hypothetical protein